MTNRELKDFEELLRKYRYRKITTCKVEVMDDYEWYKVFRNAQDETEYQIFFCFWNFGKYLPDAGWKISVIIVPNGDGRIDLHLSTDWMHDISRVEKCATEFYKTVLRIENNYAL